MSRRGFTSRRSFRVFSRFLGTVAPGEVLSVRHSDDDGSEAERDHERCCHVRGECGTVEVEMPRHDDVGEVRPGKEQGAGVAK
jgi:hypothetical protein